MRLYLAIMRGNDPRSAAPVMATEDPDVIQAAIEVLAARLGMVPPGAESDVLPFRPADPPEAS